MSNISSLNFTQMIAPQAGGASTVSSAGASPSLAEFGSALLSQVPGAALGFLTGGPIGAGISVAKGIASMVINGAGEGSSQENSAEGGKNIPDILSDNPLKTVDDSISALQSALTSMFVSEAAAEQSGITSTPDVSANTEGLTQVAAVPQGKTLDAYRAAAGLVKQAPVGSNLDLKADAVPQLPITPVTGEQVDTTVTGNAAADTLTSEISDADMKALLKQDAAIGADTTKPSKDTMAGLLNAKDNNPDALAESIRRLKNLSAMTPLPDNISKATTQDGKVESPLDKLASLQPSLTPVKQEVQKMLPVKTSADANSAVNTSDLQKSNNVTNNAIASAQQAGEHMIKVKATPNQATDSLQSITDDEANTELLNLPGSTKTDTAKVPTSHDFASHLNKTALPNPADQVAAKISQLTNGKQHITVELQPESMGRVDVKVQWGNDGNTQIIISAERKETLDALKADASGLQRALADSGIKTDAGSLQFSFKGNEFASGTFGEHKNSQQNASNARDSEDKLKVQATNQEQAVLARTLHMHNLVDLTV